MQTFELTPLASGLNDDQWERSITRDPCRIVAETEQDARDGAALAFGIAARAVRGRKTGFTPWYLPQLVEVRQIEHPGDPYLKPGHVVTDEWVIDLARPLDIDTREHLAFVASLR
jgi:hypothetical protein